MHWQAHPLDVAPDAAPRRASLSFYHIATSARAQAQLDALPKGDRSPSPALVSGDDDALVRPGPAVVPARHGADVAVLDAGGADLHDPAGTDTRYVLDSLALKAAGARIRPPVRAPAAPQDQIDGWTPPACEGAYDAYETAVAVYKAMQLERLKILLAQPDLDQEQTQLVSNKESLNRVEVQHHLVENISGQR